MALRTLSLCTGVGGLDLGLRLARPDAALVAAVEGEAYAVANLVGTMEAGALDDAPIWSDLRSFDARPWRDVVDIVVGGYPCQPFSSAGRRLGAKDPRHLWPEVARIIWECEPGLVFLENVGRHLGKGFHEVSCELQGMGYEVAATLWTAEEVGAPHRRERLFALAAHPNRQRCPSRGLSVGAPPELAFARVGGKDVGNTHGIGELQPQGLLAHGGRWISDPSWWASEPNVGRVVDGLASRVDRVRACGNGVVPQQAAAAFCELADALGVWSAP